MQNEKIPWVLIGGIGLIFGVIKSLRGKKDVDAQVTRMVYVQEYIFPNL